MESKFNKGVFAVLVALTIWNMMIHNSLQSKIEQADLDSKLVEFAGEQIPPMTSEDIDTFIMDNPEVLIKSLAKYRFEQEQMAAKQEQEDIAKSLDALYTNDNDPFIGNPNGKHVVVEFVDYNCGYCKRLAPTMKDFIAIDPEAKVIIKEFPIFTNKPTSAYSALIATAVFYHDPDLYDDVHAAFMSNNLTREFIDDTVANLGISKDDLKPHLDRAKKHIETVRTLGARLNVSGTPTVFIGSEKLQGGLSAVELKARFTN